MSRRRILSTFAAGLMLLTLAAVPAAADTVPGTESFRFSSSGLSADAFSSDCVENADGTVTCSDEGLFVFSGKQHEKGQGSTRVGQVCYSTGTSTFDPQTGEGFSFQSEAGCAPATGGFDSLNSATINPTTVTLEGESCTSTGPTTEPVCSPTEPREVVVAGEFTGIGTVTRESHRSFFDDGTCVFRDSSSGYFRSATFAGTLDGQSFDLTDASLRDGKSSFSQTCSLG